MLLALDDTDGPTGGCTTHLAARIQQRLGPETAAGFPRLVRLHPSNPWKTRGNAALVLPLDDALEPEHVLDTAFNLVQRHARTTDEKGAGLALFETPPDPHWYTQGVQTTLNPHTVRDALKPVPTRTLGNGRGLIGCLCAAAWDPTTNPHTWTRIAYREPDRVGTARTINPATIEPLEARHDEVFDCWDPHDEHATMVPRTPCPVLYGLRATNPHRLDAIADTIEAEPTHHAATFITNQATDDHIPPDTLTPLTVTEPPDTLQGGHVRLQGITPQATTRDVIAFEPTGRLRHALLAVDKDDRILPVGELREGRNDAPLQVNLEKLLHLPQGSHEHATCPGCAGSLTSMGRNAPLRCARCGHRTPKQPTPPTPTWSEADPSARRHLARPLSLGLAPHIEQAARALRDPTPPPAVDAR